MLKLWTVKHHTLQQGVLWAHPDIKRLCALGIIICIPVPQTGIQTNNSDCWPLQETHEKKLAYFLAVGKQAKQSILGENWMTELRDCRRISGESVLKYNIIRYSLSWLLKEIFQDQKLSLKTTSFPSWARVPSRHCCLTVSRFDFANKATFDY